MIISLISSELPWKIDLPRVGDCIGGKQPFKKTRHLILGRKAMTKLHSILKSRDFTLLTKVEILKAMVFLVVLYGWLLVILYGESWTIKKAECQGMDASELWCWKRLLRVPWTVRRSKQQPKRKSTLNIHWKDRCQSWNSNTLAMWCEELTHLKRLMSMYGKTNTVL